jgi:phospholipase A1
MLRTLCICLVLLLSTNTFGKTNVEISAYQQCLLKNFSTIDGSVSINELKQLCTKQTPSDTEMVLQTQPIESESLTNVQERLAREREGIFNPFALTPHRPSYLLFSGMDNANQAPFSNLSGDPEPLDDIEMIYQVSVKAPVWTDMLGSGGDLNFGFTLKSWWQLFNKEVSSPFRETNYEPELFWQKNTDWSFGGWTIPAYRLGFVHESNGRNVPLSRSWNRIYAEFAMERDNWTLVFKPWWRLPEDDKEFAGDTDGDDNPDMWKYMGYGEYSVIYHTNKNHTWNLMTRYNFNSDAKGAAELTWSFPLNKRFRGFAQVFTGYGDSLIDYNESITRVSLGIALTDVF